MSHLGKRFFLILKYKSIFECGKKKGKYINIKNTFVGCKLLH